MGVATIGGGSNRGRSRSRSRSPPRRGGSDRDNRGGRSRSPRGSGGGGGKGGGKGKVEQGKYRVQVERLPEDMGWQELKDLGTKMARDGQCTFARTRRDSTGVLEFTSRSDMHYAIKELDGR